jgi:hypothetical protein
MSEQAMRMLDPLYAVTWRQKCQRRQFLQLSHDTTVSFCHSIRRAQKREKIIADEQEQRKNNLATKPLSRCKRKMARSLQEEDAGFVRKKISFNLKSPN